MAVFNEYEGSIGDFSPFDDSGTSTRDQIVAIAAQSGSGYNTSEFDAYRQGIEITSAKYLYGTTQPKLWSGNLSHVFQKDVYGQPSSWTENQQSAIFNDVVIEFNPTLYVTDFDQYPTPIFFDNGPGEADEAVMEAFPIPFRINSIEGAFPIHRVRANLEEALNIDDQKFDSSSRITQIIDFNDSRTNLFLDDGQQYIYSNSIQDAIILQGYSPIFDPDADSFDDTAVEEIVEQISLVSNTVNDTFITLLKNLKIELNDDIREGYNKKSSAAGNDFYGPEQARYGCGPGIYNDLLRGS